jgi:hypothetical protein
MDPKLKEELRKLKVVTDPHPQSEIPTQVLIIQ